MKLPRLQLWSYNYSPEPTGIAPVSAVWARALRDRGHEVEVVTAFPHYPEPVWEHPSRPYRERIDGIPVMRLPLWVGRANAAERIRQELSFTLAQLCASPLLSTPDIMVAVSPSCPALLPAIVNARARRLPWVLWLHDILPDGAAATGLVNEGPTLRAARRLERLAYREANRIVVLSGAFTRNLLAKGVSADKIDLIYDPATRSPRVSPEQGGPTKAKRLLSIGNIGFSQGLAGVVHAFECAPDLTPGVRFVITGSGVASPGVANQIRTDRVEMTGLLSSEDLEWQLREASLGLVSQEHGGEEFNIPSKLMNYMMYGLPVVAYVDQKSEVAAIIRTSGGGWVVDNADPASFPRVIQRILQSRRDLNRRARAAREYALRHFSIDAFAEQFAEVLRRVPEATRATHG